MMGQTLSTSFLIVIRPRIPSTYAAELSMNKISYKKTILIYFQNSIIL